MSLSLHSSTECGGSMSLGSRNSSDMVSEKSRMGLISVRISSSPLCAPLATPARHSSDPMSHLNEAVCSARRSGTSRGSAIRAKEMRRGGGDDEVGAEVERDAAKWGPSSESSLRLARTPNAPPGKAHRRQQGERDDGQRKRVV